MVILRIITPLTRYMALCFHLDLFQCRPYNGFYLLLQKSTNAYTGQNSESLQLTESEEKNWKKTQAELNLPD